MDLKYLETFKTIIEEGSYARAADKLGYTQSTITFQVQQLEQELSIKLFEKIGRRMQLTKAGETLIPYVEETLLSFTKMQSLGTSLADMKQSLSVGVAETQLCYRLPPLLKKFHQIAPGTKLFLRSMNCYEIRDALVDGRLDMGIFYENVGGNTDSLNLHRMDSHAMTLIASPATKKQYPDFKTPGQRLDIPYIIDEPNCIFREIFTDYLREKDIHLGHTIELWSIPTIINLVKNDMGISYLPTFTVEKDLEEGSLCAIETDYDHMEITAVCAHHKNKWLSPVMQVFIDLLTNAQKS